MSSAAGLGVRSKRLGRANRPTLAWAVTAAMLLGGASWASAQTIDVVPTADTVYRFAGYQGGPFVADVDAMWTLGAVGEDAVGVEVPFRVSSNQVWLDVSPEDGTIDNRARNTTVDVEASINDREAARLAPGLYTGTITFANLTNGEGTTTRNVELEVKPAYFTVDPITVGGLMVANQPATTATVTLTNHGDTDLNYRLTWLDRTWFNIDRTTGTVPGGGSDTFQIEFNGFALANGVTSGQETSQVTITNTTNDFGTMTLPVTLTVVASGSGAVMLSPDEDLVVSGPERYLPSAAQHATLYNGSDRFVLWSATTEADWITVSPAGGELAPSNSDLGGGDSQDITFRINSSVNSLSPGSHSGVITIMNETTGVPIGTRAFRADVDPVLTVTPSAAGGTVEISPLGSTVSSTPPSTRYPFGQVVTLTAHVTDGYAFGGWGGDVVDPVVSNTGTSVDVIQVGSDSSSQPPDNSPVMDNPVVVTMDRSRSISAIVVPLNRELTLSFTGSGTGTVRQSPSGSAVDNTFVSRYGDGATVELTAEPDAGSAFVGWAGNVPDGGEYGNPLTVDMDRDRTIAAEFEPRVDFGVEAGEGGSVAVSPELATYGRGAQITLTASPDEGYVFDGWEGDIQGSDNTLSFVLQDPTFVTAMFLPVDQAGSGGDVNNGGASDTATLFVDIVGDGKVSPSGGSYAPGTEVMLVATPGVGSSFTQWEGDASGTDLTTTVTVDGTVSVRAVFATQPGRTVPGNSTSTPLCGAVGTAMIPVMLFGLLTLSLTRRRRHA